MPTRPASSPIRMPPGDTLTPRQGQLAAVWESSRYQPYGPGGRSGGPARLIVPDVQRRHQFGPALHADLPEHGLEVILDRERRDTERRSDLLGAAPLGGQRGDLPFARGEPVGAGDHLAQRDRLRSFDDDPDSRVAPAGGRAERRGVED